MDEIGDIARHFNRMAQEVLQRQRELEESRNYLRNLFDSIGEMIVVIDRDFRVKFANRRVLEYVGLPESEVLGQSCHRLFHGVDKPCFEVEGHPDAASCGLREAFEGSQNYTSTSLKKAGDTSALPISPFISVQRYPMWWRWQRMLLIVT